MHIEDQHLINYNKYENLILLHFEITSRYTFCESGSGVDSKGMAGTNRELDDIRRLQAPIDPGVCLANRLDLHRLASFIHHSLPHRSDVNFSNNLVRFVFYN